MEKMSTESCNAYRSVVRGDPRFIDFFQTLTPVNELGRMNIGSRPAKRRAAGSIDTLRAIPWIFAWTQIRFHLPVWLGVGEALQAIITESEKGVELLGLVGLGDRVQHKPLELSGGQQQRVAIARALANDPAIVLADEPTGNLDLKTGKEIITLLKTLNKDKGVTIISATHDLKMLDASDRIVWIRDGTIERIEDRADLDLKVGEVEGEEG